jgi:hypothetical protein
MLPTNCFIFTKQDAAKLKSSELYGYAIAQDSLIFGSDGLREYSKISQDYNFTEGRFCAIIRDSIGNIKIGAVLDNLKMGYEKDNEEEPLKSL